VGITEEKKVFGGKDKCNASFRPNEGGPFAKGGCEKGERTVGVFNEEKEGKLLKA